MRKNDRSDSPGQKSGFGTKDIIAMIIAVFELVLPPMLMIFGVVLAIYFGLRLITGY